METLDQPLIKPALPHVLRPLRASASTADASLRALYSLSIFVGAFLLFQVQLIIGKYLLPWFGGSAAVWTTCMLFFQILLVAGYFYAHLLSSRLKERHQTWLHITLLATASFAMVTLAIKWPSPITPGTAWKPDPQGSPAWQLAVVLACAVGLPFFVLSSTGPLVQRWFSRSFGEDSPYRLYSLSNIGSLLGLITYPFLFERFLRIDQQAWIFSACFALLAFALTTVAILRFKTAPHPTHADRGVQILLPRPAPEVAKPGFLRLLQWAAFAACASSMLLATTNLMCQEVAVIPLLWVFPLGLYLLSFVICFDNDRWLWRKVYQACFFVSAVLALSMAVWNVDSSIKVQIACLSLALFSLCLVCHGELAHLRPSAQKLTSFYLSIGTGGAIGGVFVGILAPLIFRSFAEYYVCLFACGMIVAVSLLADRSSWLHRSPAWVPWLLVLAAVFLPGSGFLVPTPVWLLVPYDPFYRAITGAIAIATLWSVTKRKQRLARPAWVFVSVLSLIAMVSYATYAQTQFGANRTSWRTRNFFGVKEVAQFGGQLNLINGRISHGAQWMAPDRRDEPTKYYDRGSGIGRLIEGYPRAAARSDTNLRVGVIGLGVGTLAAYGRPEDYLRFYEIDPEVIRLSQGEAPRFTFIRDSAAKIDIVAGDARLSLEREVARGQLQRFDILVIDAFSSDAIPVHLVTREALELYLRHLRGPNAVLAFHISNRCIDLKPVLLGLSREQGLWSVVAKTNTNEWILMAKSPQMLNLRSLASIATPLKARQTLLWTDTFSNLVQVLR